MPAKSSKQYKFMQMIAHNKSKSSIGPSKELADEMIKKTPNKKRSMFMKKDKSKK